MIFCGIVVPIEMGVPVKFCSFVAAGGFREDIQSCQRTYFLATSCLREGGMASALIEIRSSFYAHFGANNNAISSGLLLRYIQQSCVFKVFKFDL
jgi:hypothetical protein